MNSQIGSIWRKWDLHVHTPESIENHFPGANPEEKWEKYIDDLEALPNEVKVIGINDYVFIDGYRKVMEFKDGGRLKNIDTIFPVIEFRIKKFAGHSAFKRVNFHVIFSESISADIIQAQFLSGLQGKYQLAPGLTGVRWNALITKESLADLGHQIKATIPEEQRSRYGSDLVEGFNNLNLNEEEIIDLLAKNSYLSGNYLTAVGKTEWDSLPWGESTIAEKKDIINKADMVFISSESTGNYERAKCKLIEQRVNSKLLDCSDAHYPKASSQKERIGKCYTWIKADTTFAGLKQALLEFDDRVFVGEVPASIRLVQANPSKFIKSLSIRKVSGSSIPEIWFNEMPSIPLNTQLVTIIGNKGGGKSAIADIIGLKGNAQCYRDFSFLNQNKFLRKKPYERGANFEASIEWMSNQIEPFTLLNAQIDPLSPKKVKYLPQNYIETICSSEIEGSTFEQEIESAIFSHIPIQDRLGKASFKDYLSFKSQEITKTVAALKDQIRTLNLALVENELKLHPDHLEKLNNNLLQKNQVLELHLQAKPIEVATPSEGVANSEILENLSIATTNKQKLYDDLQHFLAQNQEKSIGIASLENANKIIDNILLQFGNEKARLTQIIAPYGLDVEEVLTLNIDRSKIQMLIDSFRRENASIAPKIDGANPDGIPFQINSLEEEIKSFTEQLSLPNKIYQEYIQALEAWELKKKEIIGDRNTPDTIANYEAWINYISHELPAVVEQQQKQRLQLATEIYKQKMELISIYKSAYSPIMQLVSENRALMDDYKLNFDATLVITAFEDKFLNFINQGVKGTFSGREEGFNLLKSMIKDFDFSTTETTIEFVQQINNSLTMDERSGKSSEKRYLSEQLKKGVSAVDVYDFIYNLDYLTPSFRLRLGNKELSELSPGERGALLLIFYLLLDKSDLPLVIDQPEENLDNQSVYNIIVKFVKKAKELRQVIIVTHNPNLAVVCDSEQIIRVSIDKENSNKFTWISGAIENPIINEEIVRILEGTMPAFSNRKFKYENT